MLDRRLMLVQAHPDDETIATGATMATYAADGAHVTLITCTAGEEGEVLVPELAHLAADADDALGPQRRDELAAAMVELGVTDHRFLGGFGRFRDSGMAWAPDGTATAADTTRDDTFGAADLKVAADELVPVIREVRPHVLICDDDFGGYGHPDHIQAHRVAHYATDLAAIGSYRPELGEPWEIPKAYWTTMSASAMRAGLRELRDSGDTTTFEGMDPEHLPPFASEDEAIDAVIDGAAHTPAKLAAMRAHATQITVDSPFFALSNNLGARIWGIEHFRLARGRRGPVGEHGWETDLFAGLE